MPAPPGVTRAAQTEAVPWPRLARPSYHAPRAAASLQERGGVDYPRDLLPCHHVLNRDPGKAHAHLRLGLRDPKHARLLTEPCQLPLFLMALWGLCWVPKCQSFQAAVLPSFRWLARSYGPSHHVWSRAMDGLASQGYVVQFPRSRPGLTVHVPRAFDGVNLDRWVGHQRPTPGTPASQQGGLVGHQRPSVGHQRPSVDLHIVERARASRHTDRSEARAPLAEAAARAQEVVPIMGEWDAPTEAEWAIALGRLLACGVPKVEAEAHIARMRLIAERQAKKAAARGNGNG